MDKSRNISIRWLKQRSGNYALKGISITEGDLTYDSSNTFREEDAKWVTQTLGARADVEVSAMNFGSKALNDNPEWVRDTGSLDSSNAETPLEQALASVTVLRHFLGQLIAACDPDSGVPLARQKLKSRALLALGATGGGQHYTLEEASALLQKRNNKTAASKAKR